jgi:pilus assembly protein CpaB
VYVQNVMRSPLAQQSMRDVVVAVSDIPFGHVIDANKLTLRSWPASAVPEGAFLSIGDVIGSGDDKPRRAKFLLAEGDLLVANKVSDFGEQVTIAERIDPRMRAVTVRVDDMTGVGGLIAPSDRIDLTLTRVVDQNLTTSTILQDVEVLGIDQSGGASNNPGRVKAVTVQVEPNDAQKLALAQQAGTLSLSLRHIDAADEPALSSISVNDLVEQANVKPRPRRAHLPSIVVNRGGERSTIEVPSG